jgi:mannose-6-phosphate isomerase-like protein (cupin superfamily)
MIVEKPWGYYEVLNRFEAIDHNGFTNEVVVKKLVVKSKQRLSQQAHYHRSEMWACVGGEGYCFLRENTSVFLIPGATMYILSGEKHRLVNSGTDDLIIIETQFGAKCDENDIVRYEDDYGRA